MKLNPTNQLTEQQKRMLDKTSEIIHHLKTAVVFAKESKIEFSVYVLKIDYFGMIYFLLHHLEESFDELHTDLLKNFL